jgi:peptide/nickel transport system permease protein
LIGGALIIEVLFSLPGLGRTLYDAIVNRDYPVVQALVALTALLLLVINLIVDISYAIFDPRIRYR